MSWVRRNNYPELNSRVSQHRPKPLQDTNIHKRYGNHYPPTEEQVHQVYVRRLRAMGKSDEEIQEELKEWHKRLAS